MPKYWDIFGSSDVLAFMEGVSFQAASTSDPILRERLLALIADLRADMRFIAVRTAEVADEAIKKKLESERKRPDTPRGHPHIRELVRSRVLPGLGDVGGVGIADENELDRVPYWYVQEVGTEEAGIDWTGRTIYGAFFGGGHSAEVPRAVYAGAADAPHGAFQAGGFGGLRGLGTIQQPIEGKHFVRDGTDAAWTQYVASIARVSREYGKRLQRIYATERALSSLPFESRSRLFPTAPRGGRGIR